METALSRVLRTIAALLILSSGVPAAFGQSTWDDSSKINKWFDDHKGKKYDVQKSGDLQKPGVLQKSGALQTPGLIDVPRGWKAITEVKEDCKQKLIVCADTLFAFDKATLSPDAEAALKLVGAKIQTYGSHPIFINGHTDAKGDDEYNQQLSLRRAERVKNWLLMNHFVGADSLVQGFGKKHPVAPNTKPDGTDNPLGRQRNRRVEIVIDTCKTLEPTPTPATNSPPVIPPVPEAGADKTAAPVSP